MDSLNRWIYSWSKRLSHVENLFITLRFGSYDKSVLTPSYPYFKPKGVIEPLA